MVASKGLELLFEDRQSQASAALHNSQKEQVWGREHIRCHHNDISAVCLGDWNQVIVIAQGWLKFPNPQSPNNSFPLPSFSCSVAKPLLELLIATNPPCSRKL